MDSLKPILGYCDIRGLGPPIRYLLSYAGVDFEDKRNTDRAAWLSKKFTYGLNFPNLPYYFDCNMKLTQSLAFLPHKQDGKQHTESECDKISLIEEQAADFDARVSVSFLVNINFTVPYGAYRNLSQYIGRFESLPSVTEYIPTQMPKRVYESIANWNGKV